MDYLSAILLGALQGVAEFLPISSSGHLVIAEALLGGQGENIELNVALHVGTLLSILVVYRRDVIPALRNPRLVSAVVVATLPIVIVGLVAKDEIDNVFDEPLVAGFGLLVTSLLMATARLVERGATPIEQTSWRQALVVGIFQAVAVLPGISRSGSTIFGGLTAGLTRQAAANFAFYIAVPAILGAAVLHAKDLMEQGPGDVSAGPLLAGTLTAFIVGVAALRGLLAIVTRQKLHWFAWYTAAAGLATILWQLSSRS